MMPIRKGGGTGLSASGYSEVRKGDGTVLWTAIPDSELYYEGENEDAWIEGEEAGPGTQSKESDNLFLEIYPEGNNTYRFWTTEEKYPLGNISEIEIEWQSDFNSSGGDGVVSVHEDVGTAFTANEKEFREPTDWPRQKFQYDISDVNGDYHISFGVWDDTDFDRTLTFRTYGVWVNE